MGSTVREKIQTFKRGDPENGSTGLPGEEGLFFSSEIAS